MAELKALMVFKRSDGKNSSITVNHADASIDALSINAAMDSILAQNIFAPENNDLIAKLEGKLITTDTQVFEMS